MHLPERAISFLFGVIVASAFIAAIFTRCLFYEPLDASPDERTYAQQASVLTQQGLLIGTLTNIRQFVSNPASWNYPTPTRLAIPVAVAATQKLSGSSFLNAGRIMSYASSLIVLIVVPLIAWLNIGALAAVISLILIATLPPEIAYGRRLWGDALMSCSSALTLLCCTNICSSTKSFRNLAWIGFTASSVVLLLSKESGFVLTAICLTAIAFYQRRNLTLKSQSLLRVSGFSIACIGSLLFIVFALGGIEPAAQFYSNYRANMSINLYAITQQNGPSYGIVQALWNFCPEITVLTGMGLIFAISHGIMSWLWAALVITYLLSVSIPSYFLNIRYLAPAMPAAILLSALALQKIANWLKKQIPLNSKTDFAIIAIAVCLAISQFNHLQVWFIKNNIQDLSYGMLVNPVVSVSDSIK